MEDSFKRQMLLLWPLLIENLPDFKTVFLVFYTVNFLCFRENRVNMKGASIGKATRKLEELAISVFDVYYINVRVIFDDFFFSNEQKKKPIHVPIEKKPKNHRLESAQYAFLDHSKTLVFRDVIKIEILFKYSRASAIRTYSSRAKKTI